MFFESDNYDEILSDLPYPEPEPETEEEIPHDAPAILPENSTSVTSTLNNSSYITPSKTVTPVRSVVNLMQGVSPERTFKASSSRKRKFPGPAGVLGYSGGKENSTTSNKQIPLSQDFPSTQADCLDDCLWRAMKNDLRIPMRDSGVELFPISSLTKGDVRSRLCGHKVPLIGGMIQSIDYSVPDPVLVLRDDTDEIQCLLHRDAWELFSKVLQPLNSVILLMKATVFTIGLARKKHYINITVNNIINIFCKKSKLYPNGDEWTVQMNKNVRKKYPKLLMNTELDENSDISIFKINSLCLEDVRSFSDETMAQSMLEGIDANFLFDDFIA